ncbi:hypothetical protein Glove_140g131 [Diversispora epigaea]|uniref:Uncharacterized protein n=1 Tax=Diversispora epigaea TaxID=1348612 RepID=A0A397J3Q5_9GLOM|nr:hypothetical protein Glove_140g131 [Diversispora epigaea]
MTFIASFILRMLAVSNSKVSWVTMTLKVGFGMESVALTFIGIVFITFGVLIITALRKRVIFKKFQMRRQKAAWKMFVIVISCLLAITSFILAGFVSFLDATIKNFWTQQTLQSMSTILNCSIIIFILQDETIGSRISSSWSARSIPPSKQTKVDPEILDEGQTITPIDRPTILDEGQTITPIDRPTRTLSRPNISNIEVENEIISRQISLNNNGMDNFSVRSSNTFLENTGFRSNLESFDEEYEIDETNINNRISFINKPKRVSDVTTKESEISTIRNSVTFSE